MKRFIGGAVALVATAALVAGASVAVADDGPSTTSTTSTPRQCDEGRWPITVQGQPQTFQVGGAAGFYIWHDGDGWHLRTTTPSTEGHSFTGTIRSEDPIRLVREFHGERNDYVIVHDNVVNFRFDTHNRVDGIDFTVGCTEGLHFELRGEGHQWPASRIWLGWRGTAPANPFTVLRRG